jgi:predicted HTH domain antitoxin
MAEPAVIEIPVHLMQAARATPDELRIELAAHLYRQRTLSVGHARELAGMSLWEFRQLIASRRIPPHYDVSETPLFRPTWLPLNRQAYCC